MQKPEFIYVYDALCGWCYGFSPVVQSIYTSWKDKLQFSVISGGLVMGERVGPIGPMAPYILQTLPRLEQTTGVTVGEAYKTMLQEGSRISDSLPPAIALALFRQQRPAETVPFSVALQQANFRNGEDLNDLHTYGNLVTKWGLNAAEFMEAMQAPSAETLAQADFEQAAAYGINGFPAVIVHKEDKYYLLARGYTDQHTLESRMQQLLGEDSN